MIRSLAIVVGVGALVAGCLSINPTATSSPSAVSPTATGTQTPTTPQLPTALPTTSAAPTPTTTPSTAPTKQPTNPPTQEPTATASATSTGSPLPASSPAGVENYGASTPLFNEGFDDPTSGWGTGVNEGGSVDYGDGVLQIRVTGAGAWEWTRRLTGSTTNAVGAETRWSRTGQGMAGLLCAASDDELWGAMEDADGNYKFIKIGAQSATVLSQGKLDALKSAADGSSLFSLDCAGTSTGAFRMQIHPGGVNFGVQYLDAVDQGPQTFDRIGIYAESTADTFAVDVDHVLAFGGDGDTSMSPEAVALMTHIPADWQPDCFESFASVFMTGVKADILCQLFDGRSDYAEYMEFNAQADMDASYDDLLNKWAVDESGVNCDTGAHQGTYTIGEQPAGRLFCAPSITGTQYVWTHDGLLIMAQLIDLEGSYPDMYTDWLAAGPN